MGATEFRDDLVSPLRVACVLDPAIDREQTDVLAYAETRDPALVVPLAGQEGAIRWFHLRPLSARMMASVDMQPEGAMRLMYAFHFSVERVDNLRSPGTTWTPTEPMRDVARRKQIRTVSDVELEEIRQLFGMSWIYEIGSVAYARADEGNAYGGSARYTLPPTSVFALERIALRPAARTPETSTPATSDPSVSSST